ncbi:Hpt domain-containing protein [Dankookia sp. GCM10030260]|uniref:Hpt domain-containing protein n=1 Tax=Dankookia sp. GCM10030260 TaxID=3273390 RepID=UPI0036222AAF
MGPGHASRPAIVLGTVAAFGAAVWGVTLHLLALDARPPAVTNLAVLLVPAALATFVAAFGAGLWLGDRRQAIRTAAVAAAGQSRLAMVQHEMHAAAERAALEKQRIALLLDSAAPGAALFDAAHHLLAWSRGFAALAEVPEGALQPGLPLADLVRLQPAGLTRKLSRHGIEAGIAGAARRQLGDGSHVEDRWAPGAEGGMLLTCRLAEPPRQAVPLSTAALAALCEEEVRTRLPRLGIAITAGDVAAVRMEAHAIRGVAASFGLDALAAALLVVETAARAGDLGALAAASNGLPDLAEDGLRRLARQPA